MAEQYDKEPDSIDQFKAWFKVDIEKAKVWRKEAEEDFRFRDGDQWNEEEKRILLDQERPVLVFNRTGVLVDAVVGSEIGNRREVRFIPREMADAKEDCEVVFGLVMDLVVVASDGGLLERQVHPFRPCQ